MCFCERLALTSLYITYAHTRKSRTIFSWPQSRTRRAIKVHVSLPKGLSNDNYSSSVVQDPPRAGHSDIPQDESCIVLRVSLKTQGTSSPEKAQKPSQVVPIGKTRATAGLAISASGERLIAIAGHKAYVAQISNLKSGFIKFVSPELLTCLAVHPFEDYFATGDAIGVVRLWYCLDPKLVKVVGVEKKSQTSTLHWHAHTVSSIAFTANGAYLLSGGEESVLVIWQVHSGKREFVPRVGSPIKNIVVSPPRAAEEEYLLGLADASYTFVSSSTLKLTRVFARIRLGISTSYLLEIRRLITLQIPLCRIPGRPHPPYPSPSISPRKPLSFPLLILPLFKHTLPPHIPS